MRNRHDTIASLRRLAERPGTPEEGDTARRLLRKMEAAHTHHRRQSFYMDDWLRQYRARVYPVPAPSRPRPQPDAYARTAAPFNAEEFPVGTRIFYNYWACDANAPGTIVGKKQAHQQLAGKAWVRIKFDHLKQARWVPVTSGAGVHISTVPLSAERSKYMRFTAFVGHRQGDTSS